MILNDTHGEFQEKIKRRMSQKVSERREETGRELTYNSIEDICAYECLRVIASLDKYAYNQVIEETRIEMGFEWEGNRQRVEYYKIFNEKIAEKVKDKYS